MVVKLIAFSYGFLALLSLRNFSVLSASSKSGKRFFDFLKSFVFIQLHNIKMVSTRLQILGILLVGSCTVYCQEETHCAGEEVKMDDHQKAVITDCLEAVGIKSVWKMPIDKLACFGVCILEKKDMMTPEGKINHEKALKYIEEIMPEKVRKPLIDGIDKCIKEHGDKVKGKDDPTCVTFMEVGQCVHEVFLDVCID